MIQNPRSHQVAVHLEESQDLVHQLVLIAIDLEKSDSSNLRLRFKDRLEALIDQISLSGLEELAQHLERVNLLQFLEKRQLSEGGDHSQVLDQMDAMTHCLNFVRTNFRENGSLPRLTEFLESAQGRIPEIAFHRDGILSINPISSSLTQSPRPELESLVSKIALMPGDESFLPSLLASFSDQPLFSQVDRICLAQIKGFSNQLCILRVALNRGLTTKSLKPGYSCWVNPQGSLFQMPRESYRCFASANDVVGHFKSKGRPPQRSIRLIAEEGFHSGLAVPVYAKRRMIGLVFMNSMQANAFHALDVWDQSVLTAIVHRCQGILLQEVAPIDELRKPFPLPLFEGRVLGEASICRAIEGGFFRYLNRALEVHASGSALNSALVSIGSLAMALWLGLPAKSRKVGMEMKIVSEKALLCFTLPPGEDWNLAALEPQARLLGLEIHSQLAKRELLIESGAEIVSDKGEIFSYST